MLISRDVLIISSHFDAFHTLMLLVCRCCVYRFCSLLTSVLFVFLWVVQKAKQVVTQQAALLSKHWCLFLMCRGQTLLS